MDTARRRALNASVAALCIEAGYLSSDRGAIELLTQILQSYICEIGRTSRAYSDSAHRSDPSVCDIELALIDLGAKYSKLDDYSRRPHRRHVPRQVRNYPHPQNKLLQVGTKKQRPAHIPPHLPPFPDNHTYVKTAVSLFVQTTPTTPPNTDISAPSHGLQDNQRKTGGTAITVSSMLFKISS
jgi:transcription initiation factor TFIID subunit 8